MPADNLFAGVANARREIWALGLRNPFTFAIARDGRMFINDVGGGYWEEVNLGRAGANYGWPTCEGPSGSGVGTCSSTSFTYPASSYRHPEGVAITGGVFYEATQFPQEYRGNYFFADYGGNWIRRLTISGQMQSFLTNVDSPVDLDVGSDGSLYALSYARGEVVRVRYQTGNQAPRAAFTVDEIGVLSLSFDASSSS